MQTTSVSLDVVLGQEPQVCVIMYSTAEQLGATGVHFKESCNEPFLTSVMLAMMSEGGGKGTIARYL